MSFSTYFLLFFLTCTCCPSIWLMAASDISCGTLHVLWLVSTLSAQYHLSAVSTCDTLRHLLQLVHDTQFTDAPVSGFWRIQVASALGSTGKRSIWFALCFDGLFAAGATGFKSSCQSRDLSAKDGRFTAGATGSKSSASRALFCDSVTTGANPAGWV